MAAEESPHESPGEMHVLGIPGSVRPDSFNLRLLDCTAQVADDRIKLTVFFQPELEALPPFNPEAEFPEPVVKLRDAVESADAVLVATPEYNGSLPGWLKNALDWLAAPPREGPIRGKPAAVIGADRGGIGCDWAHADARKVLEAAGARVVREGLSICDAEDAFNGAGLKRGEDTEQLERVVDELVVEGSSP